MGKIVSIVDESPTSHIMVLGDFNAAVDTLFETELLEMCRTLNLIISEVQLGPRYEEQLNPMAEPIPHEVRPLVRTHVYHPYHAADRQAETDS